MLKFVFNFEKIICTCIRIYMCFKLNQSKFKPKHHVTD